MKNEKLVDLVCNAPACPTCGIRPIARHFRVCHSCHAYFHPGVGLEGFLIVAVGTLVACVVGLMWWWVKCNPVSL